MVFAKQSSQIKVIFLNLKKYLLHFLPFTQRSYLPGINSVHFTTKSVAFRGGGWLAGSFIAPLG